MYSFVIVSPSFLLACMRDIFIQAFLASLSNAAPLSSRCVKYWVFSSDNHVDTGDNRQTEKQEQDEDLRRRSEETGETDDRRSDVGGGAAGALRNQLLVFRGRAGGGEKKKQR